MLNDVTRLLSSNYFSVLPDGKVVLYSHSTFWRLLRPENGTIQVLDIVSGQCLTNFKGHDDAVNFVSINPNGKRLVSASADSTIRVWDIETGHCLHILTGHKQEIFACAFIPNTPYLISASKDCTLGVWDLVSGELIKFLTGHRGPIPKIEPLSEGIRFASISLDKSIRYWNLESLLQNYSSNQLDVVQFTSEHSPQHIHEVDKDGLISGFTNGTIAKFRFMNS